MPLDLAYTTDDAGRWQVLRVLGEVDMATVGQLEDRINSLARNDYSLVLDLTATEFMDSTGLRLLVATHELYASEGNLFRIAAGRAIARLLDVTELFNVLDVYDSVEEAVAT